MNSQKRYRRQGNPSARPAAEQILAGSVLRDKIRTAGSKPIGHLGNRDDHRAVRRSYRIADHGATMVFIFSIVVFIMLSIGWSLMDKSSLFSKNRLIPLVL